MQWPWTKAESDLEREVRYHIESLADAYEREGMTREEALRRAETEFGGVDRAKEQCRDLRWWNWLAVIAQDLRFGWRMMRKTPAITVAAVVSLALGIGATGAIVALADTLLWRTLAVPAPEQLGEVFWESGERPEGLYQSSSGSMFRDASVLVGDFFSRQTFAEMRSRTAGKGEVAAHCNPNAVSASFRGAVAVANLRAVTGNFFTMLRLQPYLGRLLDESDDRRESVPAVVATYRFWEQRLGADPGAAGRPIRINNTVYSIVGILPETFRGIVPGDGTEIYAPLENSPELLTPGSFRRERGNNPDAWWLQLMARRAPGVSIAELRSLLDIGFASSWMARPKSTDATPRIRLTDASRGLGSARRQMGDHVWMLLGLVALVLLVACANIANLLLARAVSRQKEVALRVSLGCGEGRLVRQFFTESLLLAAIGGALSVPVTALVGQVMAGLVPLEGDVVLLSFTTDLRSLSGAAVLTILTAVLFGLYPAWRATRIQAGPALKEGAGSAGTISRTRWAPAKMLILFQVSLGVVLLTAAILFTNHLNEIVNREAGFERNHAMVFDIRPGEVGHQAEQLRRFYIDLEERLNSVPGVAAAGIALTRPMKGGGYWDNVRTAEAPEGVGSGIHHVTAGFLGALGVPLVSGRELSAPEISGGKKVALISEDLAQELGLLSPLGARISVDDQEYEVIGVARPARYAQLVDSRPIAYLPFDYERQSATVVVRTSVPPMALLRAVANVVKEMDPNLPLVDLYTMEEQISRTLQRERLFAWLCGSFGVLALVLCVVGLYGLMSHTTARRTPEMGIRIALGASRGDVIAQVLWEGMRLAAAGLVLGVPLALYGAHVAAAQKILPEGAVPYWTLAGAIGILAFSAAAAVIAPALRASSVEPMRALRQG